MINIKDIFVGETVRVKNDDYEYYVKLHLIDEDNSQVYCADEVLGISMWYDIANLEKLTTENTSKENDGKFSAFILTEEPEKENPVLNDEFLAFVKALEEVAKFNGLDIPQVEIEEEPNVVDDDFDDFGLDFDGDYEDDILDERYDGNRFPWYKFSFYQALEELKFQYVNEDANAIWYMTNGERALTFKDERLVDVRLADHVENLVYFAAPIQLKDLNDKWEVNKIVDEETRKIQEIAALAESLHNESLIIELLEVIEEYL